MRRYFFLFGGLLAILSAGNAFAASPPTIERTWHWNVGARTAGLSMSYRNHDQKSRVWFEYSKNSGLSGAQRVAEDVMNPNSGGSQWHATLTGLQPNTEYYYRAFIRNYDGETYSPIGSFRTAPESASQPSITFDKGQKGSSSIDLQFVCNGSGAEGTCSAYWSTSAGMSGERELKSENVNPSPVGRMMYAKFAYSAVPDDTTIYVQGVIKTAHGTAKTGIHSFLIRNKPI